MTPSTNLRSSIDARVHETYVYETRIAGYKTMRTATKCGAKATGNSTLDAVTCPNCKER